MSWIRLNMRFPGKCMECGKPIPAGQPGLWSRGVGVMHLECAAADIRGEDDGKSPEYRIACAACGRPAGCHDCEFQDICDIPRVSPRCLCRACLQKGGGAVMELYRQSAGSKFPILQDPA